MEYLNITAQWRLDLNFGTAEMKVIKHIIWQQGGENYKKNTSAANVALRVIVWF